MAVLNLRDVPDELARELRVEAAQADMGVREYCVAVLSSRKKIADISVGGGATEGGGDPCLPRGGKAQDGEEVGRITNIPVPPKLEAIKSLCVRLAGERQDWQNSMAISDAPEAAAVDKEFAYFCYTAGIKLDREILVRWGLAENSKPKTDVVVRHEKPSGSGTTLMAAQVPEATENNQEEKTDGAKGSREAGQDRGSAGGDSQPVAEGDHGSEKPAVGVGKPGVNMQALRDICAGKMPSNAQEAIAEVQEYERPDPHEVDLCGFKSYNETDGEWYVCTKKKHGVKVKHGEWLKV